MKMIPADGVTLKHAQFEAVYKRKAMELTYLFIVKYEVVKHPVSSNMECQQ
jgi:hypothetical protein